MAGFSPFQPSVAVAARENRLGEQRAAVINGDLTGFWLWVIDKFVNA